MKRLLFMLLLIGTSSFAYPLKPNHHLSPGSFCTVNDPDFTEFRYEENIPYCTRNVSFARKNAICKRDGVDDRKDFVVDHIIPLSIGGNNKDDNLWCQHHSLSTASLEYNCYTQLKNNQITRLEATNIILNCKFNHICPEICEEE